MLLDELIFPLTNGIPGLLKFTLGLIHLYHVLVHHIYALCPQLFTVVQGGLQLFIPLLDGSLDLFLVFLVKIHRESSVPFCFSLTSMILKTLDPSLADHSQMPSPPLLAQPSMLYLSNLAILSILHPFVGELLLNFPLFFYFPQP